MVHGLGYEPAQPDWPPLGDEEVADVVARYGLGSAAGQSPIVTWHSPRPLSAAALARVEGSTIFVKRHSPLVRSRRQLFEEHGFAAHLHAAGIAVPGVARALNGHTAVEMGGYVYEVHQAAPGVDLYRDVVSWAPYSSLGHARSAGAALARAHLAASAYDGPQRAPAVLSTSCEVVIAEEPEQQMLHLLSERPALAAYLDQRPWMEDFEQEHFPTMRRAGALLRRLPRQWGHGDWHPSNLSWTSPSPDAEVAAIFDLGLSNLTSAAHDLATAIERAIVSWLDLAVTGHAEADLDALEALLTGYESQRGLTRLELEAVAEVFPVVHFEYALSEVEYFAAAVRNMGNADVAYKEYLIGHSRWCQTSAGSALTDFLRRRAASRR